MRCPGQDRRYWTEDAVFEVPCPKCDRAVEFFKDESSGRCTNCGYRFSNPRVSFDCARWCAFAEECLGWAARRESPLRPGEGALAARLIRTVIDRFQTDRPRLAQALAAFRHAKGLLAAEGGDPRIVLAAALLLEIEADPPGHVPESQQQRSGPTHGPSAAGWILQEVGLDEDTIACVCHVIDSHRAGKELDTVEFKIACDCHALAKLATGRPGGDPEVLREVGSRLKTGTGKALLERIGTPGRPPVPATGADRPRARPESPPRRPPQ
jgi:hypothetical protein